MRFLLIWESLFLSSVCEIDKYKKVKNCIECIARGLNPLKIKDFLEFFMAS